MKLRRHLDVGTSPTWEVRERDVDSEKTLTHLVRHAEVGELIYLVPADEAPRHHVPATRREDSTPVRAPRPDPRRLEPLRAALRRVGRDLVDCGAHHFEVVPR